MKTSLSQISYRLRQSRQRIRKRWFRFILQLQSKLNRGLMALYFRISKNLNPKTSISCLKWVIYTEKNYINFVHVQDLRPSSRCLMLWAGFNTLKDIALKVKKLQSIISLELLKIQGYRMNWIRLKEVKNQCQNWLQVLRISWKITTKTVNIESIATCKAKTVLP